jgi:hypothetical protein
MTNKMQKAGVILPAKHIKKERRKNETQGKLS